MVNAIPLQAREAILPPFWRCSVASPHLRRAPRPPFSARHTTLDEAGRDARRPRGVPPNGTARARSLPGDGPPEELRGLPGPDRRDGAAGARAAAPLGQ